VDTIAVSHKEVEEDIENLELANLGHEVPVRLNQVYGWDLNIHLHAVFKNIA
jgi:hypothetical protein